MRAGFLAKLVSVHHLYVTWQTDASQKALPPGLPGNLRRGLRTAFICHYKQLSTTKIFSVSRRCVSLCFTVVWGNCCASPLTFPRRIGYCWEHAREHAQSRFQYVLRENSFSNVEDKTIYVIVRADEAPSIANVQESVDSCLGWSYSISSKLGLTYI